MFINIYQSVYNAFVLRILRILPILRYIYITRKQKGVLLWGFMGGNDLEFDIIALSCDSTEIPICTR